MIKKIFAFILTIVLFSGTLLATNADEGQTFKINNNKWTIEVTKDSIFVWTVEKNTAIIDLFKSLNIDWKSVIEDTLTVLDVRYISPDKVDYKISSDTDIIDKNSEVYVLFKSIENGWLVSTNSTIDFELKTFVLKEIWIVSDLKENSYSKVYNITYVSEDDSVEVASPIEEQIIDNVILEENNTGIKDNILLIVLGIMILSWLFLFPNSNKITFTK